MTMFSPILAATAGRDDPQVPGPPDILLRLKAQMNEDSGNKYWYHLLQDYQGAYCLRAERSNGLDNRMLFYVDTKAADTLRVVHGMGWDRCALGLSYRPEDPPDGRYPRIITEGMSRLVTFASGLELYLIDVPLSNRLQADELLRDLNVIEHYFYQGRRFVEPRPFDLTSDPYAAVIPYVVFPHGGDTTWLAAPQGPSYGGQWQPIASDAREGGHDG